MRLYADTPLQSYLGGEISPTSQSVYLVDSAGSIVATSGPNEPPSRSGAVAAQPFARVDPKAAAAATQPGAETVGTGAAQRWVVTNTVPTTPWRVVFSTPTSLLDAQSGGLSLWTNRIVMSMLALVGLALIGLFERTLSQRSSLTEQAEQLTELNRRAASQSAMMKSIIDNSQSAISVKSLDGRLLMANPIAASILGRPEVALLGLTTGEFGGSESALARSENDILARSGRYHAQEWIDTDSDGRHFFDSVKFPLIGTDAKVYAICGVSLDITEQRRATAAIAESRDAALAAVSAKAAFLAMMSHEIRTPMNAVIGMTELLRSTALDQEQSEFVNAVHTSGEALLTVINDILDFSKIEAGQMTLEGAVFNLREMLENCVELVAPAVAAKSVELVCNLEASLPDYVTGDSARLRQIVANLLSNAAKFTARGEIVLTGTSAPIGVRQVQITMAVSDTGIGIPADKIASLFSSFSQVDSSTTRVYGGTGLGLTISKRIAEAMAGGIEVTSTLGAGSTFAATVMLERAGGPSEDSSTLVDLSGQLVGKSVLLVDDNTTSLRVVAGQLEHFGLVCTACSSADAAIALVGNGLRYDVAILDMVMPGQNGEALGAALRQVPGGSAAPLVLLTSMGARPVDVGGDFAAFLTKPVKRAMLGQTLIAALSGTTIGPAVATAFPIPTTSSFLDILLAEDNRLNQRVAQLMLAKLGQEVQIVDNGYDAVLAVQSRRYDIVLMDVQMPQMDGLEATRRIRALPDLIQPYIVALTANSQPQEQEACRIAGMNNYLAKPVRAAQLQEVLVLAATEHERAASPRSPGTRPTGVVSGR